jgi:hypothetical protein
MKFRFAGFQEWPISGPPRCVSIGGTSSPATQELASTSTIATGLFEAIRTTRIVISIPLDGIQEEDRCVLTHTAAYAYAEPPFALHVGAKDARFMVMTADTRSGAPRWPTP